MSDDLDEYIEMRQELEVMTHAELVEEVINRMKFQQQIVIDNWNEKKSFGKKFRIVVDFSIPLMKISKNGMKT